MNKSELQRCLDRVNAEDIVSTFDVVKKNEPFVYGECVSRSSGERYQVSLQSCTCQAAKNERACKHRVALALMTGHLGDLVPTDEVVITMAIEAIEAEILYRERNPHVGIVVNYAIYDTHGEGRSPHANIDEVGFVTFERRGLYVVERGTIPFLVRQDGTIGRGSVRNFSSVPLLREAVKK